VVDNLKPLKTNDKEFFAVVKKDLIRANIDSLHEKSPRKGVGTILFRADIASYDILDYQ
jgi:hypothetical protein